jgi:hypothetical protein
VITVRGVAFDVVKEEVAELLHLEEPLLPQRLEPSHQEIEHTRSRLIGPESIELLAPLAGDTSRRNTIQFRMATWDRVSMSRPQSRRSAAISTSVSGSRRT